MTKRMKLENLLRDIDNFNFGDYGEAPFVSKRELYPEPGEEQPSRASSPFYRNPVDYLLTGLDRLLDDLEISRATDRSEGDSIQPTPQDFSFDAERKTQVEPFRSPESEGSEGAKDPFDDIPF